MSRHLIAQSVDLERLEPVQLDQRRPKSWETLEAFD